MNGLHGYYFEDISVGMSAVYSKTITDADILMFSGVSGDTNPLHLNQVFAENSIFKSRIAHGMLSASFLSTIFGTKLPGPGCIYLSQNLRFKAPVRVGDTVLARATVRELIPAKRRALFDCSCSVGETVVIEGDAVIMIPARSSQGLAAE